ncbi:MAG: hypothetical protein M3Y17_01840 [Actinomycetota bacterium]|nr:hypothetical protein [Actinomycetota bacterium]
MSAPAIRRSLPVILAGALAAAGCGASAGGEEAGRGQDASNAPVVTIAFGGAHVLRPTPGRPSPGPTNMANPITVRTGQRILVQVTPPWEPPSAFPTSVVSSSGWGVGSCSAERCYPFLARAPGVARIDSGTPCLPAGHCIAMGLGGFITFYVEPAMCPASSVTITPATPSAAAGSLRATAVRSSGRGNRQSVYALARFTDSDHEGGGAVVSGSVVNWGDGLRDGGSVRQLRGGGYEVFGSHFYCALGTHRVTVTITKGPAAIYHTGESVTVKLAVEVTRRRGTPGT